MFVNVSRFSHEMLKNTRRPGYEGYTLMLAYIIVVIANGEKWKICNKLQSFHKPRLLLFQSYSTCSLFLAPRCTDRETYLDRVSLSRPPQWFLRERAKCFRLVQKDFSRHKQTSQSSKYEDTAVSSVALLPICDSNCELREQIQVYMYSTITYLYDTILMSHQEYILLSSWYYILLVIQKGNLS